MLNDLKNKRILITGASIGIGAALARTLAPYDVQIVVHGNSNAASAEQVAEDVRKAGSTAHVVLGDVTKPEQCAAIVKQAADAMGGIDILVNNAGSLIRRLDNADFENELFDQIYDLNVRSIFNVTKAALPYLKEGNDPAIVNTGSIAGRNGGAGGSVIYASAKAAVHSITRNQAKEFAPLGIRVNTVAPGFIETAFHVNSTDAHRAAALAGIPIGRLGEAEDCMGAYMFLISPSRSRYVTGQIIDVNGGQMMP